VDRLAAAVAEKVAALSLAEANTTAAEEQSLPSLPELTLQQCATPAEIAVICQFTYLESERLPHCTRHVNVEHPQGRPAGVFKVDQGWTSSSSTSSRLHASISINRAKRGESRLSK
jgi:hypothetical protein